MFSIIGCQGSVNQSHKKTIHMAIPWWNEYTKRGLTIPWNTTQQEKGNYWHRPQDGQASKSSAAEQKEARCKTRNPVWCCPCEKSRKRNPRTECGLLAAWGWEGERVWQQIGYKLSRSDRGILKLLGTVCTALKFTKKSTQYKLSTDQFYDDRQIHTSLTPYREREARTGSGFESSYQLLHSGSIQLCVLVFSSVKWALHEQILCNCEDSVNSASHTAIIKC